MAPHPDHRSIAGLCKSAKIDARIGHLEKLAEEQARVTRTVESIKAEIAAEAKNRDNQWAFKKDSYVNHLTATSDVRGIYTRMATYSAIHRNDSSPEIPTSIQELMADQAKASKAFCNTAALASLAIANEVFALVNEATTGLRRAVDIRTPEGASYVDQLAK